MKTTRLIKEKLKNNIKNVEICFQSRFGPQEWLQPYMQDKFKELISRNMKKICVIAPSFVSDCLETLEEIKMEGKEDFIGQGGEKFSYISCINDDKNAKNMFVEIIKRELSGWM